jgi:hypothetical protein
LFDDGVEGLCSLPENSLGPRVSGAVHSGGKLSIYTGSRALPAGLAGLCFVFAVIGFGTKAGFMPMHVWQERKWSSRRLISLVS